MWKVYISRWINYRFFLGDPNEMLSSRIHRECWLRSEALVDLVFFWHIRHCTRCYRWERIHAKSHQVTTEIASQQAEPDQTVEAQVAPLPEELVP